MASVKGTVRDPTGVGIGSAQVEFRRADGTVASAAVTGSTGAYGLSITSGTYTPSARKAGYVDQVKAPVAVGEKAKVDFVLRAAAPAVPAYRLTSDLHIPQGTAEDQTDRIAAAVGAITDQRADVVLEGLYRIDHALIFPRGSLRVLGAGSGIEAYGFIRPAQLLEPEVWPDRIPWFPYLEVRVADLTLEGFSVIGPLAAIGYTQTLEKAHGIHFSGAAGPARVANIAIRGVHGDFLTLHEAGGILPGGILAEDITGDICGRQMVAPVGGGPKPIPGTDYSLALYLRRFLFKNGARSACDFEPSNDLGITGVLLEDGVFDYFGNFGLAAGNNRPVRQVTARRVRILGGRGGVKFGRLDTVPDPYKSEVRLEDLEYDYRRGAPRSGYPNGVVWDGTLSLCASAISITRLSYRTKASTPQVIAGNGTVEDSAVISDRIPPPAPLVCLRGVADGGGNSGFIPCA